MIAIGVAALALAVSIFCLLRVFRLEKQTDIQNIIKISKSGARGGDFSDSEGSSDNLSQDKYRPYESNDEKFILRLEELIYANLSNHDLNVDFLATGMMVSRSLLFNRVRRATGKGIVEYVNELRIEHSIGLFSDETKSLTEIAELCGFSTLRYYSRVFKSLKGEIPSTYRERLLGEKLQAS